MDISQGKKFEKPAPGMYLATLVDVVDRPQIQTQYGVKDRIRFHWLLAHLNGQLYIGKDGTPIEATKTVNATLGPKSDLTLKILYPILGQAPPVITSTEQLESLVLGRSNLIVLAIAPNPKDVNDPYINVDGIGPIQAGMPAPPAIPPNYVRFKNRPKTQAGPQGTPVQTFATPQAAAAAGLAVPPPATAPAAPAGIPTPEQIAAYLASQQKTAQTPGAPVNLNAAVPAPTTNRPF